MGVVVVCITQVWLAVYQLLLNPESQRKYQFNMSNKSRVLKVWGGGGKEGVEDDGCDRWKIVVWRREKQGQF